MISLRAVTVVIPAVRRGDADRVLLHPLTLDLAERRIALVGANGSGKSTLLRTMAGRHGHFVTEFLLNNARTLARDRKMTEAIVFAQAAVADAPGNSDAMMELAARHAALGDDQAAEQGFRSVLEKEPGHVPARDELTAFLALRGRWDEAEQVLLSQGEDEATRVKHAQLLKAREQWQARNR